MNRTKNEERMNRITSQREQEQERMKYTVYTKRVVQSINENEGNKQNRQLIPNRTNAFLRMDLLLLTKDGSKAMKAQRIVEDLFLQ
jgi:hypothetical protein